MQLEVLMVVLLQLVHAANFDRGQTNIPQNDDTEADASKKLEDAVVTDMLKIVDHKFDTLTTRITALERAVSGLQFYSIRQFRQLSGYLKKTQGGVITVGKKVGQLETDGRGLKIAMSLLGRDMAELKSTTNDMLSELESSVVYINDNVDKQASVLKNELASESKMIVTTTSELLVEMARKDEALQREKEVSQNFQNMNSQHENNEHVNCSADVIGLQDHLDVRFSDFTHAIMSQWSDQIADIQTKLQEDLTTDNISCNCSQQHQSQTQNTNDSNFRNERNSDIPKSNSDTVKKSVGSQINRVPGDYDDYYDEENDRITDLLINMTTNVMQATSYFRPIGGLVEEILATTDHLSKGQRHLQEQIQNLQFGISHSGRQEQIPISNNDVQYDEDIRPLDPFSHQRSNIQNEDTDTEYSREIPKDRRDGANCGLPDYVINGLVTVVRNGSQLLEIITDLAQMSSVSLAKTATFLQQEVREMGDLRERIVSTLSIHTNKNADLTLKHLKNSTKRILNVVESNSGWLSLILRNNQRVEKLANKSLSVTNHNNHILMKNHKQKLDLFDISEKKTRLRQANQVLRTNNGNEVQITDSVSGLKNDFVLDKESIETIYTTSLQLNRIMPALTKLLAEPDPLFTLVGGGGDDQGRLEIYLNGQWGTVCHKDLTNQEADAVCRHLGFVGGFSAGGGRFGSGTGVAWTVNVTCLELELLSVCSPVKLLTDMSLCDHEKDVAVICDHMLRIVRDDDNGTSSITKVGRLEIMHQGLWRPVCGEGWSGFSSRVACKHMGFVDGREIVQEPWLLGVNATWLNKVACTGDEPYLEACPREGWSDVCKDLVPAGVRCL